MTIKELKDFLNQFGDHEIAVFQTSTGEYEEIEPHTLCGLSKHLPTQTATRQGSLSDTIKN